MKKYDEAGNDWDRAIELSTKEERPDLMAFRANTYVKAGKVAKAVADVTELTKNPNWEPGRWYNFACVYAVAAEKTPDKKQEYCDRAMEMLQKAVKTGWNQADHISADQDFNSIRDRDDFKKLLAVLEKKENKR